MKVSVNLADFLRITNLQDYKIHLACSNGEFEPLDLFYTNYDEWVSWNEYYGNKDDFNRQYILSLIEEYDKSESYLFAGVFKVIERYPEENRYEIEEVSDYDEYKGKLRISFHRYQGLRGRSFKLESFKEQLIISEILDENVHFKKVDDSRVDVPNIFSFATSELSQDAMFAWMLQWADDANSHYDSQLCTLGKKFASLLTGIPVEEIHSMTVGRQWCNIDIWAEINQDAILIVEDKTNTSIHDDQLTRYKKTVENEYEGARDKQYYAYVKTGNEPLRVETAIKNQGYRIINRQAILSILQEYDGDNALVVDYRRNLQSFENSTNNFRNIPSIQWNWYEWQGFYKALEEVINVDNWGYVANPAGGFQGLWWHFIEGEDVRMYLQFEESKLCVKIEYYGENRSEIRWKYFNRLLSEAEKANIKVEKPTRFGSGTYMTIGVIPQEEIFGDGIIDFPMLTQKLKELENLVDNCVKE